MTRRAVALPIATASILATLLACATRPPGPAPLDGDQMNAEYRTATRSLRLPPGAVWRTTWPTPPPMADAAGSDHPVLYAPGDGTRFAEAWWYCSWAGEWLDQRERSAPRARAALDALDGVADTSYYSTLDGAGRSHLDATLRLARQGGASLLEADVRANCTGPGWPAGPPPWRDPMK